jgi:hypothetical protein
MTGSPPVLSVIVPVYQGATTLDAALSALAANALPRESWELIVVDDASTDDSALIAARYADRVIRLVGRPRGPAYARNRGFEIARAGIIVFIDADVRVAPDALERFLDTFRNDDSVAAITGSYDRGPEAANLVTRYRNLLHQYLRLRAAGDVDVFWAACGAIRRSDFAAAGLFDEWHYWRPQAEGVELGHRLRRMGRRILLEPTIVATHLKHWTLGRVLEVDLFQIGVPWMRLLIQEGTLRTSRAPSLLACEIASTALSGAALLCGLVSLVFPGPIWTFVGMSCLTGMLLINAPFIAFVTRERGVIWLAAVLPLHLLHYLVNAVAVGVAWALHETVGEPQRNAADDALAEVGVQTWPPVPQRRTRIPSA